jgi:hypothetical protein
VQSDNGLTSLTLDLVSAPGGAILNGDPALTVVNLPNLQTGTVYVQNDGALVCLRAPALTTGTLNLSGDNKLPACLATAIQTAAPGATIIGSGWDTTTTCPTAACP